MVTRKPEAYHRKLTCEIRHSNPTIKQDSWRRTKKRARNLPCRSLTKREKTCLAKGIRSNLRTINTKIQPRKDYLLEKPGPPSWALHFWIIRPGQASAFTMPDPNKRINLHGDGTGPAAHAECQPPWRGVAGKGGGWKAWVSYPVDIRNKWRK